MRMGIMDKNGLDEFPVGGGYNPEEIGRLESLINENRRMLGEMQELKADLEHYGIVKLSNSQSVTDSTGMALPASEKNAAIKGTLAYEIQVQGTELNAKAGLGSNMFNGSQCSYKNVHPGAGAALNAQFQSACSMNEDAYARAGYGFNNIGQNHGFLYLDNDNSLKFTDGTGQTRTVTMS